MGDKTILRVFTPACEIYEGSTTLFSSNFILYARGKACLQQFMTKEACEAKLIRELFAYIKFGFKHFR